MPDLAAVVTAALYSCGIEDADKVETPAVLAALREACTIETVDQLDALPIAAVVMPLWYLDAGPCWKLADGWHLVYADGAVFPLGTGSKGETALLLWHPGWSA